MRGGVVRQPARRPRGTRPASASISGEWKAWLTREPLGLAALRLERRRDRQRPRPRHRRHHRRRAVDRGDRRRRSVSSGSDLGLGRLRPRPSRRRPAAPASAGRARPPARTRPPATARPATCAAASSPIECPARKSGRTPQRLDQPEQRHLDREQRGLGERRLVQQRPRRRAEHHLAQRPVQMRVQVARTPRRTPPRTPGTPSYSSRPMPSRWLPCPVNRNASPPGARGARDARRRPARPSASAARPAQQLVAVGAEHHRAVLERGAAWWPASTPTSAGSSVRVRRRGGRAAARPAPRSALGASGRTAATAATGGRRRAGSAGGAGAASAGACSRMTWALVPLMPNDDTPARRGRPVARPRPRPRSAARPRPPTSPRAATARRRAACAAARRAASPCTILITPGDAGRGLGVADVRLHRAQPQRPVRRRGPGRTWPAAPAPRSGRRAWCRCRAPPPRPRRPAVSPASASACRITRCCDGPFGAVSPLRRAVLVDRAAADHRQHPVPVAPRVRQPLHQQHARRPRPSRCRRRAPANALHRPSAASPRCRLNSTNAPGVGHHRHAAGQRQRALAAAAAPAPPGAARPATTSTPCPPSPPGPPGRTCTTTRPDTTLPALPVPQVALDALGGASRSRDAVVAGTSTPTNTPVAAAAQRRRVDARRARTPPRTSPAAAAAAGPSPAPRAGGSRRSRRRTRPASCRKPPSRA